jgi:hypothetical protein
VANNSVVEIVLRWLWWTGQEQPAQFARASVFSFGDKSFERGLDSAFNRSESAISKSPQVIATNISQSLANAVLAANPFGKSHLGSNLSLAVRRYWLGLCSAVVAEATATPGFPLIFFRCKRCQQRPSGRRILTKQVFR